MAKNNMFVDISGKDSDVLAFAESRTGGRSENQDSYGWADTQFGYLVTVCDGMGGGPGGRTASSMAVSEIIAGVQEGQEDLNPGSIVVKAIQRANLAIIATAEEQPQLRGMGSTATVLLVNEKSAWIAHVGDSRVYQLRDGKKVYRTFDHSMVFEMVSKGVITEEQARLSEQSNIITRALGIKPEVEVDIVEVPYLKGDRFVLSTDGIHGTMPERELIMRCEKRKTPLGAIVDDIATYVDNQGRGLGNEHDNLTLAIVETKHSSKLKAKMSKEIKLFLGCIIILCLASLCLNFYQARSLSEIKTIKKEVDTLKTNVASQDTRIQTIEVKSTTLPSVEKESVPGGKKQ